MGKSSFIMKHPFLRFSQEKAKSNWKIVGKKQKGFFIQIIILVITIPFKI